MAQSFKENIHETIDSWFQNIDIPAEPSGLYDPIRYAIESGGKRLRPTLLLASAKAFGCPDESVRNQCLAVEMFHNFTLVHDDVMDRADLRRGRPTVHHQWNENTAILSGDAMLTMATELLLDGCPEAHLRRILTCFNTMAMEVYEGQQLDMDFENRSDITVDQYIEMIRLKTSVLLAAAMKIGAIVADAPGVSVDAMYEYGINLGLGFQLRDDYLDTFGDPLLFGKNIGSDILNDKKTWLMINAVAEDTTGTMKAALAGKLDDEDKIAKVTETYRRLGLDSRILELINYYSAKAIDALKDAVMNPEAKDFFVSMAHSAASRTN